MPWGFDRRCSPCRTMIDKPGSLGSSELTTRLLQRYVEPLGVIGTRHPQQLQARTAGWIARRFGLLDHWRRYESDESAPAADQNLVFAATPRSQEDGAASRPVIAADPGTAIARSFSPMVRVSRPGARLPDASVSAPSSEAQSQTLLSPMDTGARPKHSEGFSLRPGARGEASVPASIGRYPPSLTLNRSLQGGGNVAPAKPITSPTPRLSRPSGEGSVIVRQEIRRKAAAQPSIGRASKEQEPARSRSIDSHASMVKGEGRGGVEGGAGGVGQAMPLVQRQTEPAAIDHGTGATRPLEIDSKRTPVVAEIAPAVSSPPVLIWRKSDGGSSNSTAAGPAASSSPPPRAMPPEPGASLGTETAPVATEPRTSGDLDMAQLAEQVSRMLSRQLAVARERRGMKR